MTRWTPTCTDILNRMARGGYTDQEIADHIEWRTGLRFTRYTVLRQRRARQIGPCWRSWAARGVYAQAA